MAYTKNRIKLGHATRAQLDSLKSRLLDKEIFISSNTNDLGFKNGDNLYFLRDIVSESLQAYTLNETEINSIRDALETSKQDKLVAGDNITIDETTNVISASGGGAEVDLNEMVYFDYAGSIYGSKYNLLLSAWEHSLTVDPLEISADGSFSNNKGRTQYPNGETEGVIIPQGVTSIGENAFSGWSSNNQPLIIPNSVTTIGNYAFYNWSSNNQPLIIPNGVTTIGSEAFYYWTSNNQPLIIPNSVTTIGNYAFYNWSSNNQPLTIPSSVTEIGYNAFYNWSSAKEFIMESETPPTIDYYSFYYTNNAPFYVPDNSVEAYKTATNWSAMARRIFPMSDRTGGGADVTTSTIGISIADIFSDISTSTEILVVYNYVGDDPANFTVDFSNFALGEGLILEMPDFGEIPANIAVEAIFGKTTLNYFEILIMFRYIILGTLMGMIKTSSNNRIKSILDLYTDDYWKPFSISNPNDEYWEIFSNVFKGINFINVDLDSGDLFFETFTVDFMMLSEDAPYFDAIGSGSNIGVVVETAEDKVFGGELTVGGMELKFFPDIKMKPNYNISGDGIDLNTFVYMNYAADIFNRGGHQSLFSSAWEHSLTIDPLEISENSAESSPRGTVQYPNGASEGVIIPQGVTNIGGNAFYNWIENNQPLVIPNSVTSIGYGAFAHWESNNQPLIIPNSVTNIGSYAFRYWESNNQPLIISNRVTSIGPNTFRSWIANNQPLVIPNSVTSIGVSAFAGWESNNQPLVISNSVTSIGNFAFDSWIANNQPLVIPNSVTSIGMAAFGNWNSAKEFIMESETPPTILSTSFNNTDNALFYVPNGSVEAYKTATNWKSLANRIFPISDRPQEGLVKIDDETITRNTDQELEVSDLVLNDINSRTKEADFTSFKDLTNQTLDTKANVSDLSAHTGNKNNPHSVTKSQVGLTNVENKSSATIRSEITTDDIPSLDASKITSGTINNNRLPSTFTNLIDGTSNLPYRANIVIYGDSDKYYPVHFAMGDQNLLRTIKIWRAHGWQAPDDWYTSTHKGSLNLEWKGNYGGWGGAVYNQWIYENTSQYTTLFAGTERVDNSFAMAFFLRGGGETGALYQIASDQPLTWSSNNLTYTEPTAFYDEDITYTHSNSAHERYAPAPRTTVDTSQINSITVVKGNDARLTNSRPASDVSAWAKKSSLAAGDVPNLNASKINAGTFSADRLPNASESASGIITTGEQTIKGNKTFDGDTVITGDLTVSGTNFIAETTTVRTNDDLIELRSDGTTKITTPAGIAIRKYDGTNDGGIVIKNDGEVRVGNITIGEDGEVSNSDEAQPVLTRAEKADLTKDDLLVWDEDNNRAVTKDLSTLEIVPTSRTIAGLNLTDDITRDAILGVSTSGYYRRTGTNTYDIRTVANLKSDLGLGSLAYSSSINLGDLINVTLTSPSDGQVLKYNGSGWVNSPDNDTDTKNTAGATDTSDKIFLVGATDQEDNPQTYSDDEVYVTSGVLTTKEVQVGGTAATMKYDSTSKSIKFVFE